jgi:hypothetical protein
MNNVIVKEVTENKSNERKEERKKDVYNKEERCQILTTYVNSFIRALERMDPDEKYDYDRE